MAIPFQIDNWKRDPTVLFTILVILIPLMFTNHGQPFAKLTGLDLESGAPNHAVKTNAELRAKAPTTFTTYLFTPMLWLSFLYLFLVVYVTRFAGGRPLERLSDRDTRVANWFLMNGVYFNMFCDVVSGQFQMMDELSNQYRKVEPRYMLGPFEDAGQSVFWTSMCELFFQSPFCILCYYAYYRHKSWRRPLEIIVGVLHTAGVWWFYVPEAYAEFRNLGGWPKPQHHFHFHNLVFFWFGFWFMGTLWVVTACTIAWTAFKEISEIVDEKRKTV